MKRLLSVPTSLPDMENLFIKPFIWDLVYVFFKAVNSKLIQLFGIFQSILICLVWTFSLTSLTLRRRKVWTRRGKRRGGSNSTTNGRKFIQMQPVWLCILSGRQYKETFKNTQCGKAKEMQPMRLCLFSCRSFEDTFKNAQWRKVKQMQAMRLCLFSGRRFEDTL